MIQNDHRSCALGTCVVIKRVHTRATVLAWYHTLFRLRLRNSRRRLPESATHCQRDRLQQLNRMIRTFVRACVRARCLSIHNFHRAHLRAAHTHSKSGVCSRFLCVGRRPAPSPLPIEATELCAITRAHTFPTTIYRTGARARAAVAARCAQS